MTHRNLQYITGNSDGSVASVSPRSLMEMVRRSVAAVSESSGRKRTASGHHAARPAPMVAYLALLAVLCVLPVLGSSSDPLCDELPADVPALVRENCLTGNDSRDWDISGAGDHGLQGFSGDISYPSGSMASFFVTSTSRTFRADIYRLGYYGGSGARKVHSISVANGVVQPDCRFETETLLYDCANWVLTFTWSIPKAAVSGLYFARLVRPVGNEETWRADGSSMGKPLSGNVFSKTGATPGEDPIPDSGQHAYGQSGTGQLNNAIHEPHASHIWFVVRNDDREADILFQTSDTTWQAYNRWGGVGTYGGKGMGHGAANYGGQGLDPANPGRRAFKVSYNRPLVTRDYRAINMPLGAEYPMIRFLEMHGYDVNYASGPDTHRMGLGLLQRHKVFLSIGHDEYWSGPQREAVEQARDSLGMHLLFLSGNEVFWRIRWEDGFRTMVCYKESQADTKLDPVTTEWTGTFRDSRAINPLGANPENSLTGQIFTVNAWRNDPLTVPARYRSLRFWRNTTVSTTPASQPVHLLRGLLGHEWDEDLDNGYRPAGIVHLSETSVDNVMYIQDFGATYDSGSGTHHLTLYKVQSGALVFGAGTVQWSWGLDAHHDGASGVPPERSNPYNTRLEEDVFAPEESIQQATVNLLGDMSIQPKALQRSPHLVRAFPSEDHAAPKASIVSLRASHGTLIVKVKAHDLGGGQVAMVEVSCDSGHSWHQAEPEAGENAHSGGVMLWGVEVQGLPAKDLDQIHHEADRLILARAIDDSLNMVETVFSLHENTHREL